MSRSSFARSALRRIPHRERRRAHSLDFSGVGCFAGQGVAVCHRPAPGQLADSDASVPARRFIDWPPIPATASEFWSEAPFTFFDAGPGVSSVECSRRWQGGTKDRHHSPRCFITPSSLRPHARSSGASCIITGPNGGLVSRRRRTHGLWDRRGIARDMMGNINGRVG